MEIKETKELLEGVNEIAILLIKHLKDGLQLGKDASEILAEIQGNEALKAKLVAAAQGMSEVPAEIKDLSLAEGVELAVEEAKEIPAIVEALKE